MKATGSFQTKQLRCHRFERDSLYTINKYHQYTQLAGDPFAQPMDLFCWMGIYLPAHNSQPAVETTIWSTKARKNMEIGSQCLVNAEATNVAYQGITRGYHSNMFNLCVQKNVPTSWLPTNHQPQVVSQKTATASWVMIMSFRVNVLIAWLLINLVDG